MTLRAGPSGPDALFYKLVQLAATNVAANSHTDATVNVPGAVPGDLVTATQVTSGATAGIVIGAATVTAPGVVTLRFENVTAVNAVGITPFVQLLIGKPAPLAR